MTFSSAKPSASFLLLATLLVCAGFVVVNGGTKNNWKEENLLPPVSGESWEVWIASAISFRQRLLDEISYNDSYYSRNELKWAQSAYVFPQVMAHDRYLYNETLGEWTVDKLLDDFVSRYGGVDAVLIWPTYPNIGVDDRNQYDLIASMPGGIPGVINMTNLFHARGVSVLLPYHPWDLGTRIEPYPDFMVVANMSILLNTEGINGDTMNGVTNIFQFQANKLGKYLALQSEDDFPETDQSYLQTNVLGWGENWIFKSSYPSISSRKWFESRFMENLVERWNQSHAVMLQNAYFNGIGYVTWENIWSYWNQLTPFDAESLRRVSAIERQFNSFLISSGWFPYWPNITGDGVYASFFPSSETQEFFFTIINQGFQNEIATLNISSSWVGYNVSQLKFVDVYHGKFLDFSQIDDDTISLQFNIEGLGYGGILGTFNESYIKTLDYFTQYMNNLTSTPLSSYSSTWNVLTQIFAPKQLAPVQSDSLSSMIYIPGTTEYTFAVSGIEIEGPPGNQMGLDVQYPWESYPTRNHSHIMSIDPFYIDIFPVTNQDYSNYLQATDYVPKDPINWLRDWQNGTFPSGWESKPVTWVSFQEAEAYCNWASKRLPHEWEWQYAAQNGSSTLLYPWGSEYSASNVPKGDFGNVMRGPDNVDAHPSGVALNGIYDLVGNVWQWTDMVVDEHTASAIVKGGSYYRPQVQWGQSWYFPQAYELNTHGKYLLMSPSLDRSGGIGFRCVADVNNALF